MSAAAGSIFSGVVTNGGDLTVATGGLLKATELDNLSSGKVFNFGTINDDLLQCGPCDQRRRLRR